LGDISVPFMTQRGKTHVETKGLFLYRTLGHLGNKKSFWEILIGCPLRKTCPKIDPKVEIQ